MPIVTQQAKGMPG